MRRARRHHPQISTVCRALLRTKEIKDCIILVRKEKESKTGARSERFHGLQQRDPIYLVQEHVLDTPTIHATEPLDDGCLLDSNVKSEEHARAHRQDQGAGFFPESLEVKGHAREIIAHLLPRLPQDLPRPDHQLPVPCRRRARGQRPH